MYAMLDGMCDQSCMGENDGIEQTRMVGELWFTSDLYKRKGLVDKRFTNISSDKKGLVDQ